MRYVCKDDPGGPGGTHRVKYPGRAEGMDCSGSGGRAKCEIDAGRSDWFVLTNCSG